MRLCILFTVISICSGRSPVDKTPLLKFLDDEIYSQIYDPTKGQAKDLVKNLRTYNKRLVEVFEMIDQDVYDAFVKSKSLLDIGGPQFLTANFDKGLTKYVYNWTDADVKSFKEKLEETKKRWEDIVKVLPAAEKKFDKILTEEKKTQQNVFEREKQRIKEFDKEWEDFQKQRKIDREHEKKTGTDVSQETSDSDSTNYDSSKTFSASSNLPSEFEAKSTLSSLEKE